MFDIGFFELLLIAVVMMLVVGPEQLPSTLRSAGLWWGRAKRAMQATRSEFEQQIGADDVRRQLHNEEIMRRLEDTELDIQRNLNEQVADIKQTTEPSQPPTAPETTNSELLASNSADTKPH